MKMGLIWEILKVVSDVQDENEKKKQQQKEKEMKAYELEEWQKELVRKGEYDPWNFEEDGDLEEDDYYNEDDK